MFLGVVAWLLLVVVELVFVRNASWSTAEERVVMDYVQMKQIRRNKKCLEE